MNDPIGDRMKRQYENITRYYLPRRTYTIIRIDGKSFHTWTKGLQKPYDANFNAIMDETARYVLSVVEGGQIAYTQSDEISVLMTDFAELDTQAWFGGNLQKICSVSASAAAAKFNKLYQTIRDKEACFDARVFTIPDRNEVANYFLWRTRDCIRNSINCLGQHYFSHKQLHGKNISQVQDMLHSCYVNWNSCNPRFKTGSLQTRKETLNIPETNLFDFYKEFIPGIPS